MVCKSFLGVPQKTLNKMVNGELGHYPLFVNGTLLCLKYWLRVLKMEDNRIPKQAYKMMISMDENEQKSWVTEVKHLLSRNGFYCVCYNKRLEMKRYFFK